MAVFRLAFMGMSVADGGYCARILGKAQPNKNRLQHFLASEVFGNVLEGVNRFALLP